MWSSRNPRVTVPLHSSNILSYLSFRSAKSFTRTKYQQPPEPDQPPWHEHAEGWKEEFASDSEAIVKAERHGRRVQGQDKLVIEKEIKSLQTQTTKHLQRISSSEDLKKLKKTNDKESSAK